MLRSLLTVEPQPLHNENGHFYRLPTKIVVPSVTTILDGAYPKNKYLLRWLANQGGHDKAETVKHDAARKGGAVHDAIFYYMRNEPLPRVSSEYSPEEVCALMAFREWQAKYEPKAVWQERCLWSAKHAYAGRADLLCWIKKKLWLIDFKTSKKIWKSHRLQLLAYAQALRESGQNILNLALVRLDKKTGKFEWHPFKFTTTEFKVFLYCYEMWKYTTEISLPK